MILHKTAQIAQSLEDPHWQMRYERAMASNLLGLIFGHLESPDVAVGLCVTGMQHFDAFLSKFARYITTLEPHETQLLTSLCTTLSSSSSPGLSQGGYPSLIHCW